MKPGVKWLLVVMVALIATWAGIEIKRSTGVADPDSEKAVAQLLTMPFTTAEGQTRTLADWQSKVLVINFWATWCPPCREEMPEFSQAQEKYGSKGIQFVGIAIDEAANVAAFSKKELVNYPLLIAPAEMPGMIARLGNQQQGLPFTLIVSRDGKLISRHLGRLTKETLEQALVPLL